MRPGIVLDAEPPIVSTSTANKYMAKNESMSDKDSGKNNENTKPSINCFAQILLGIKCEIDGIDENTGDSDEKLSAIPTNSIEDEKYKPQTNSKTQMQGQLTESYDDEKITTVKDGLLPDRDEVFIKKPLISSQTIPISLQENPNISTLNTQKLGTETNSKLPCRLDLK